MPLQPSPLLRGFEQGADGEDVWNRMMPGEERGPLALDPQGVALGQQFQAIKAGIEAQQARQARPIWDQNNPVGTETVQSMGMPKPTIYAGRVGEFIDPATGQLTDNGKASLDNPMLGVDTGGLGMIKAFHGSPHAFDAFSDHAIGTGEGAQAYGYGHYLAENEGIARGYRDVLSARVRSSEQIAAEDALFKAVAASNEKSAALEAKGFDFMSPEVNAAMAPHEAVIKALQDKVNALPQHQGHMYEVNVAADPEKFLHWDKPLSEQHPDVQKVLGDLGLMDAPPVKWFGPSKPSGESVPHYTAQGGVFVRPDGDGFVYGKGTALPTPKNVAGRADTMEEAQAAALPSPLPTPAICPVRKPVSPVEPEVWLQRRLQRAERGRESTEGRWCSWHPLPRRGQSQCQRLAHHPAK